MLADFLLIFPRALSRSRHLRWTTTVLALAAISYISVTAYIHHRYKHFAIHDPGKVYRSAWVDGDVFEELANRYEIKTVVNLCYPGEMGEQRSQEQREALARTGARLIELPFPSNHTWDTDYPSIDAMDEILADASNYPIWVHCQHGRERTVKALAMYDIKYRKLDAHTSLAQMPLFGDQHPWPIVAFAFNYQSELEGRGVAPVESPSQVAAETAKASEAASRTANRESDRRAETHGAALPTAR